MAKKLRRAFTIVELVIVIAVIAILAAVLIPTFTSLIDKANQSADTSNVKNMNTILSMDETTNGKPKTMYDAVKVIREGGYDLEKLTPTGQGYDIVWDQDANRLLMVNGDEVIFGETEKNTNDKHLWVVIDSAEKIAATEYSVYLTDAFAGEVTAAQGVDVGSNEDITKVTYNTAEEQNITIRTNGGALEVSAAAATVSHYGAAASVEIQKVANESYHEYGTVEGNITLVQGRFVAEDNSSAAAVIVTATDVNAVKIVVNDTTKKWSIAAVDETVSAGLEGIVSGNTTNAEIAENPVVSGFAGGVGTESSPYLISNEEQFRNINSISSAKKTYFAQIADIDIDTSADNNSVVISKFNGVYNGNGFYINHSFNSQGKVAEYADELFDNVINGVFNNVNYNMIPKDANYGEGAIFVMTASTVVFDNVDVYGVIRYSTNGRNQSPYIYWGRNVEFKNCDANANIYTETYSSVFVGYPSAGQKYSFEDCTFNGEIVGSQVSLLFANNAQFNVATTIVTIKNVKNNGTIMGYKQASLVFAQGSSSNEQEIASQIVSNNKVITLPPLEGFSVSIDSSDKIIINQPETTEVAYYTVDINQYETWYYKNGPIYTKGSTMISITKTVSADELSSLNLYAYELRQTDQGFDNAVVDPDTVKYSLKNADYTVVTENFAKNIDVVESNGQRYYLLNSNKTGLNNDEYIVISNPSVNVKVYAYNAEGDLLGIVQA